MPFTPYNTSSVPTTSSGFKPYNLNTQPVAPVQPASPAIPAKPAAFKYPITETTQEKIKRLNAQAETYNSAAKDASSFSSLITKPLLDTVAPSEKALGETIGGIMGTQRYAGDYAQRIQALSNQNLALAKSIREKETKGIDTTNLKKQFNSTVDLIQQNKDELAKLTAPAEKSNLQVGGEIGGTALDLLTAGTYGKATAGMSSGVLAPIKGLPSVAGSLAKPVEQRAGLFTGQGVKNVIKGGAKGAGLGYGYDVSQNAQAGKTGLDLVTPGTGTVLGGSLGAGTELALGAERSALNGIDKVKNSPLVKGTFGEIKNKINVKPTGIVQDNLKNLQTLEDSYSSVRRTLASYKSKGIDAKKMLAESDLMVGSVDDTGTIRTQKAISNLNDFIAPQEKVISGALQRENKLIPLQKVKDALLEEVNKSKVKGGAKLRAIANVEADIEGLKLDSTWADNIPKDQRTIENATIPLQVIHDAKIDKTSNINYLNPESKRVDKSIARGLKKLVEDNTDSVDVKKLNQELSSYYAVKDLLNKLDGKKVIGGKLGKYFAQVIGGAVGSHFGPVGTIVGAEVGGKIRGNVMKSKFSRPSGGMLNQSEAMQRALELNGGELSQSKSLGNLNTAQSTQTAINNSVPIQINLLPKKSNIVKESLKPKARPGFAKLPGISSEKPQFTTKNLAGGDILRRHKVLIGGKQADISINDIKELDELINIRSSRKAMSDNQAMALESWRQRLNVKDDVNAVIREMKKVVDSWTRKDVVKPKLPNRK